MASERRTYEGLASSGELAERAERARAILSSCRLCGHRCGIDRLGGQLGRCGTGATARVASFGPHFGEEGPLVGRGGSGTIFFGSCNLACVYCQNADISQHAAGQEVSPEALAGVMTGLQSAGCENVNLVSPTHFVPAILDAVLIAAARGLEIPLVYNTGTYDSPETLALIDGVIDIYLADAKYSSPDIATRLSGASDYPEVMRAAIREMHRQVGDLVVDRRGLATHGLLVRHLVLPHGLSGTGEIVAFLVSEISRRTFVNVMAQYRPSHRANEFPELARRTTPGEHAEALEIARAAGLDRACVA